MLTFSVINFLPIMSTVFVALGAVGGYEIAKRMILIFRLLRTWWDCSTEKKQMPNDDSTVPETSQLFCVTTCQGNATDGKQMLCIPKQEKML